MLGKRTYERTHPWLIFDLRANRFSPTTWMLLGEATSKAKHIAGVPLAPEIARKMHALFLAKGAQATTAIEGNTLTEEQVKAAVEGKLRLPPSQKYLQQEVQNVIDGCNQIVDDLTAFGPQIITPDFCLKLNAQVLKDLELEEGILPGEIRRHNVTVGGAYRGAPPEDCAYLLERMCDFLNESAGPAENPQTVSILKALFAHMYIALIHPFGDGNGRTARLLEYYILLQAGLPSPAGHLLSNHYNQTRSKYYVELDKISKSGGDTASFVAYALQGFVDGLKEQIELIRSEHMRVGWENYVHQQFRGKKTVSDARRRELVLQIGAVEAPPKVSELMELSGRIARDYAGKTDKTMVRDLNTLVAMGLLRRVPGRRVAARKEIVSAFLPWRAPGDPVC